MSELVKKDIVPALDEEEREDILEFIKQEKEREGYISKSNTVQKEV